MSVDVAIHVVQGVSVEDVLDFLNPFIDSSEEQDWRIRNTPHVILHKVYDTTPDYIHNIQFIVECLPVLTEDVCNTILFACNEDAPLQTRLQEFLPAYIGCRMFTVTW